MIKKLALIAFLSIQVVYSRADNRISSGIDALSRKEHPRLFINSERFELLKTEVAKPENVALVKMHKLVQMMADEAVEIDLHQKRELDASGKRMLHISRRACQNLCSCAYSFRMTGDKRYLDFAETELLNVCAFSDWNESHFLDIAEMAMGVSVAYDWLYDELSPSTKSAVIEALYEKAFTPALYRDKEPRFYTMKNNWNQVCNGGLVAASIAACEAYPYEAEQLIEKAVRTNLEPIKKMYSPDGNYMEGYGYWQFGTTYQVLLLMMLDQTFGTDFGLSEVLGFLQTGDFILFMKGICGAYNHSDCSSRNGASTALWYFADKLSRPDLLYNEQGFLTAETYKVFENYRLLPLMMGCAANINMRDIKKPQKNMWYGRGDNPVALIRKDWTASASDAYLAVKAGKASNNHGHMDAGSFVYDANGVRWSIDMGMQDYAEVEKAFKQSGGSLWNMKQDSQRWSLHCYNNFHHTTITLNNALHKAEGAACVSQFIDVEKEKGVVMDMSEVFDGHSESVERTVKMMQDGAVVIIDKIMALDSIPVNYSWRMVTKAKPEVLRNEIVLRLEGKELVLKATSNVKFTYREWNPELNRILEQPMNGVNIVGLEADIPSGKSAEFVVRLCSKIPRRRAPGNYFTQ